MDWRDIAAGTFLAVYLIGMFWGYPAYSRWMKRREDEKTLKRWLDEMKSNGGQ